MTTIKVGQVEFDLVKIYNDVRNKSVLRLYDPELDDYWNASAKQIEHIESEARKHYPLLIQWDTYSYIGTSLASVRSFGAHFDHQGKNVVLLNGLDLVGLLDTAADQMLYDIGIRDTLCIVTRKETMFFSYLSRMCRVSQKYRGIVGIEMRKKLIKSFSDRMFLLCLRQHQENGPDYWKPVLLNGAERQAPLEMRLDEWIYIVDNAYYSVYHVNDFIVSGETLIADLPCNCKILTK